MDATGGRPPVTVIIPNYNGASFLQACLPSLQVQTFRGFEIVVVDNASRDGSLDIVARLAPAARTVRMDANLGFAAAVNAGARIAVGEWLAVLNNDTELSPTWLEECMAAVQRYPDAAFLACRIIDMKRRDRLYSAGDCFLRAGIGYRRGQELLDREAYRRDSGIFAACGCAALYRRSAFESNGGFDERFFAYMEDVDLALRLQAGGHRGYYVAGAEVFHQGGGTSGGEFSPMAVRLRTRNSICVLIKDLPAGLLLRWLPLIAAGQFFWAARAAAHGRIPSYLRGLVEALGLVPAMYRSRLMLRPLWKTSKSDVRRAILRSEALARADFHPRSPERSSLFLRCYFRLFRTVPERT